MIAAEIDDEDATDEEVEEDAVISSSDEEVEKDEVIFDSGEDNDDSDEDNDDNSDEDDNDSYEDDDSKDIGSESSYEEAQEDLSTKSKDNKLKNKSKNKSLLFKGKTSTSNEITPIINKLKNDKNHRDSDEMHKDDIYNKQETKNISKNANEKDEYVYDSSDEEDIRNTVGNVPIKWYDEYDHLGYDWEGKKIPKPEKGDELDNFLKRMEDPDFWRTIKDSQTGQDVVLSEADIDLIVRIQKQKVPDAQFDEYTVSYIYDNLI